MADIFHLISGGYVMPQKQLLMQSLLMFSSLVIVLPVAGQSADNDRDKAVSSNQDTTRGASSTTELLVRCDDIGMCHSVNLAVEEVAKTGIRFSASVLFVCPWYREAVGILKRYANVAVGVHLALNSEWMNYKWGPVSGRCAVPSLADSDGYFFGTTSAFKANGPKIDEVEKELRAQIERAIRSGLDIKYLDCHMSAIDGNPEYMAIVRKLAKEYHLVVSRSFGERDIEPMYSEPIDKKADVLIERLSHLSSDSVNLLVCHIALSSIESDALIDSNPGAPLDVGKNRQAELSALLSPEFMKTIKAKEIKLVNYADLASRSSRKQEGK